MFTKLAKLLSITALLSVGFVAGWWTRGLDHPTTPAELPVAAPALDPQRIAPQAAPLLRPATTLARESPATEHPVDAAPAQPQPEEDIKARFRTLLDARSFNAAMNLYVNIERHSREDARELKSLVLSYLQRYLNEYNSTALTGLVDAFLSRYYDDLDVLLLLARHQLQSDYLAEAAHTFQLAYTYAYSGAEQQQVQRAFQAFVQEVDQLLSGQARWRDLIGFYETLELLGLTQPGYQLRQAELYLAQGEPRYGRELLRRLTANPAVADRAEAMLAGTQSPAEPSTSEFPADSVTLGMVGGHYHLPLRLNDAVEVELLIDTGATTTTVSRRTFDAIRRDSGFVELGPQMFNTANGVAKGTVYRVARVQLGNHVLEDVHIAVLDFDMPPGIDGLLGMNVLRNFRFQVDQDEQRLYLTPRRE